MLLEMVTDPNVPPLPPHVSVKQARHYAHALIHGDPDAMEIVKASAKEVWDSLTGGKR
jgi:pyruvate dehydrogenase (quinone)